jgi:hypothetical protein
MQELSTLKDDFIAKFLATFFSQVINPVLTTFFSTIFLQKVLHACTIIQKSMSVESLIIQKFKMFYL